MPNKKHLIKKTEWIRNKNPEKVPRCLILKFAVTLAFIVTVTLLAGKVQAQMLYVKGNHELQSQFPLSNVSSITFADGNGNVQINHLDGNISTFNTDTLQYLSFRDYTTGFVTIKKPEENNIRLWPNPASTHLNVQFELPEYGNATFIVTDIQGRVLIQQEAGFRMGKNSFELNIEGLPEGMFFLRLQNQHQQFTTKFLKH